MNRAPNRIRLETLLANGTHLWIQGSQDRQISLITSDSRLTNADSLFVAIKGSTRDGHNFITEAYSRGTRVFAIEDESRILKANDATFIVVPNTREFLDQSLCLFYGDPSQDLICIGVTGTNGKTTVTHLVELMLNAQNIPTAVMGTIDHHLGSKTFPTDLTTANPELLQKRIVEFKEEGAKALAMEVSSHALDQKRADSIKFNIAVFTNLTRDHLDYHASMQDYFNSKERLFNELLWKSSKFDRFSIINGDDPYGRWIKSDPQAHVFYYGLHDADFIIRPHSYSFEGTEFSIEFGERNFTIRSKMIGLHNAYNLTAAFAVGAALKLDLDQSVRALESYEGVKGRLERVANSRGLYVFVDYAHTDDALKNVLISLRDIRDQGAKSSKIITVFGCGGDRDRGKRPLMAKVAETFSDQVIVTSDNPRTESPSAIIQEITAGFSESYFRSSVRIEVDRAKAIALALGQAQLGDVVLIAGKGHEDYQILGKEKVHFSDAEVVRSIIIK